MRDVRRQGDQLARADLDEAVILRALRAEAEAEAPLEHDADLFVLVCVRRHAAAAREAHFGEHHLLADHAAALEKVHRPVGGEVGEAVARGDEGHDVILRRRERGGRRSGHGP